MIRLFPQAVDSVPFFLQKEVVASIDTIPKNEFLSYQFLPLDSSKLLYNVEAFNHEAVYTGLHAVVRPFMEQYGSLLFLVFALFFIISSFIYRSSGRTLFNNFGYIFTLGNRNKNLYNEQITTSDVWGHVFLVFQTIVFYSILFFALTLQHSELFLQETEYLFLFGQIMVAIFIFMFLRYVVYRVIGAVFFDERTNGLLDTYLWVVYLTGILSFIPLLLYIYIPEIKLSALIVMFAIFIIGRFTVFIKGYTLFNKSHIGVLYYFVYLCGVEIMPYFLVFKAISFMI